MLITKNLSFIPIIILRYKGTRILTIILAFLLAISCNKDDDSKIDNDIEMGVAAKVELPKRSGSRPETTMDVPHVQIGVELVPEVNEELFRRVYSVPGIENRPSVIGVGQSLWLTEEVTVVKTEALISGREFAHIHPDGSLHIFLKPSRSYEAVETCWAIYHPYTVQRLEGWDNYVMLYTPQSLDELDVTFQLIVDGFNYVTGQSLLATDYY